MKYLIPQLLQRSYAKSVSSCCQVGTVTLVFLLMLSCGKEVPKLDGIDLRTWRKDQKGCGGDRSSMIAAIEQERNKLLALDEIQIVKLLGNPDRNELFKRNQKFYYYFLEPAPECKVPNPSAKKLIIRFNAMGLAKEVEVK
jgi:hypothetical protein